MKVMSHSAHLDCSRDRLFFHPMYLLGLSLRLNLHLVFDFLCTPESAGEHWLVDGSVRYIKFYCYCYCYLWHDSEHERLLSNKQSYLKAHMLVMFKNTSNCQIYVKTGFLHPQNMGKDTTIDCLSQVMLGKLCSIANLRSFGSAAIYW